MTLITLLMTRLTLYSRKNSPYKAKWQIPKLILKAWMIIFNALNYISIF